MKQIDLYIKEKLAEAKIVKEEMEEKSGKKMMDLIYNKDSEVEEMKNDFCEKIFHLVDEAFIYLVGSKTEYLYQVSFYFEKIVVGWQTRYKDGDYTKSYKHCLNAYYYILKHFGSYQ